MFDALKKKDQNKFKNIANCEGSLLNDKKLHDKLDKALKDIELGNTRSAKDIMREMELEYNS